MAPAEVESQQEPDHHSPMKEKMMTVTKIEQAATDSDTAPHWAVAQETSERWDQDSLMYLSKKYTSGNSSVWLERLNDGVTEVVMETRNIAGREERWEIPLTSGGEILSLLNVLMGDLTIKDAIPEWVRTHSAN